MYQFNVPAGKRLHTQMGAFMKGIVYKAWAGLRKPPKDSEVGASHWPNPNRSQRSDKLIDVVPGDQLPRTQNCGEGRRTGLEGQRTCSTDHPWIPTELQYSMSILVQNSTLLQQENKFYSDQNFEENLPGCNFPSFHELSSDSCTRLLLSETVQTESSTLNRPCFSLTELLQI